MSCFSVRSNECTAETAGCDSGMESTFHAAAQTGLHPALVAGAAVMCSTAPSLTEQCWHSSKAAPEPAGREQCWGAALRHPSDISHRGTSQQQWEPGKEEGSSHYGSVLQHCATSVEALFPKV